MVKKRNDMLYHDWQTAGEVLTSGISLQEGNWTWFGAGDTNSNYHYYSLSNTVGEMIDDHITTELDNNETNSSDTQCLVVSWAAEENGANLTYSASPCMAEYTMAVCEVRVYTQTWYVWATTNWLQVTNTALLAIITTTLQILFLFTLVLLIVSSCVTVQVQH